MVNAYTSDYSAADGVKPSVCMASTGDLAHLANGAKPLLRVPFDVMREQYASAVRAGLVERSLLASARFERMLGALERATLGSWARTR